MPALKRRPKIKLRYVLDFAEIPTVTERAVMGVRGTRLSPKPQARAYLRTKAITLRDGLTLTIDGKPAPLAVTPVNLEVPARCGRAEHDAAGARLYRPAADSPHRRSVPGRISGQQLHGADRLERDRRHGRRRSAPGLVRAEQ